MLRKKMIRDLLKNKIAYLACAAIISIGLMTYVSMENVNDTLHAAVNSFYTDYRFSDGFAYVKSMPINKLDSLENIPGVEKVTGKLVKDVRVLFPGREENVYLRLVSIDLDETERLNEPWIMEGSPPEAGKRNVLLGIKFYDANNLSYGDVINVIINGRTIELTVGGKAQSPEHVYVMKNITDFLSSARDFGVAYIPYDVMEELFGANGEINEIAFDIDPSYSFQDVKNEMESKLKGYEISAIVEKKDQISNFMMSEEMKQLEQTSTSIPVLFLFISSIILWIMLKRLVEQQRVQIGTLKANGYSSGRILFHYVSYAVVIGIVGGIVGGVFGFMISNSMTQMYNEYYTLPNLKSQFSLFYFIMGIVLSVIFSCISGVLGAKNVLKLEPAESMLPPAPVSGKKVLIERLRLLWNALTVQGKMAVRNIFRSKGRSIFTLVGVAFAFSLMASLFSFVEMFDIMIFDNFTYVQKYDVKITVSPPQNTTLLVNEFRKYRDIELVEPIWEVPVTLKNAHMKKDTVLLGIKPDSELYHVVKDNKARIPLPENGILLAEPLAEKLNVEIGDLLEVETPYSNRDDLKVRVAAIAPQYIGTNGYMRLNDLNEWLGSMDTANSVLLRIPEDVIPEMKEELNKSAIVSGIEEKNQTINKYVDMMDQFFYMIYVMAALAVLTGFAIIYNSSLISLSERERELASLRVMGMSNKEVIQVLSFEQLFLAFFGVLIGIPLTFSYNQIFIEAFNTDLYRIPISIEPYIFVYAFVGTALALLLAFISIRKRIKKLDMVEVLKARE